MKKLFLIFIFFNYSLLAIAQFSDGFSDGDFTNNPTWNGDVGAFEVDTAFQLHLNDTIASSTCLSTESNAIINGNWVFDVRLDFNPSTSNYTKVFLISDEQDLRGNLNGYFVKIGGESGNLDDISLYSQSGSSTSKIIDGTNGVAATNPDLKIKVTRDDLGNWELFTNTSGTYFSEGTVFDNTITSSDYFGVYCKYTSTRSDKFWFDNFNVSGTFLSDTTKPEIMTASIIFNNSVLVEFSEDVDLVSAQNINNYSVDNGIGNPNLITLISPNSVELVFTNSFISPTNYQLSIQNVEDLEQNIMLPFDTTFTYFIVEVNDIIINEIFADPSPSIGLPDVEYIELYNTTDSTIDLTNWTVRIGTTDKIFPTAVIEPDSFLILIKEDAIDSFPNNISKIGFSSISIPNTGTSITLKNPSDSIINSVTFTDNWYNDANKDDGGWSLELINPNSLCLEKDNWSASNDISGGTPGRINSIYDTQYTLDSLYITDVFSSGHQNVVIKLSRGLDGIQLVNVSNYFIAPIGHPTTVLLSDNNKTINLIYADSLSPGNNYNLQLQNILEDCLGNSIDTIIKYNFPTPFAAIKNEVVINEIFIDETPPIGLPECEYIELYNNTNKLFSLSGWKLLIKGDEKTFPLENILIEPDSFVILIKEDAIDSFPNNISKIGLSSISLTNTGSDLVLKNADGKTINTISYTDKWYNDDNKSDGGWSIERVNPNLFCERENNWKASVANIGGTPGKQNSVMGEEVLMKPFRITKAFIIDSNKVQVHFNKSLDSLSLLDGSLFSINGIPATKSTPLAPFFNSLNLTFGFTFLENNTYTVSANGLIDCSGNLISNSMDFGIADSAKEHEIIINEVLFNPKEGGVDYVEIYNNSSFFFDLSKLNIAEFIVLGNYIDSRNPKIITEDPLLIAPKTYLVLTTDTAKVKSQYYCENPYAFIEIASMPAMSNDTGTICIVHQSLNQIIDAFAYSENMHFSLLESVDGVSLERLSFNDETQKNSNWHSAASTVGFGTPSYKNSQEFISQSVGEISIDPKSFSPNNDGYKDVCSINWDFSKTNLMATIKIFDSKGRLVKNSLNNKMIGNSGSTSWDGTSEEGLQLNTGIYIVWMEIFSESGNVEQFKEIVVLSR